MRRFTCILLFGFALSFIGCGSSDSIGVSPQDALNSNSALDERASIRLNVISSDEQSELKASIGEGSLSVTCIIKLLKPEDPTKFDEIRKTATVTNGSADFVFNSIPARSALIKLIINGGKIGSYAELRGAKDLAAGENIVSIAGTGSNLEPDVIAATIENLAAKGSLTTNIENNLIASVKSAYITAKNTTGTSIPNFMDNVSQVYLANKSQPIPQQDNIRKYLNQFAITTSFLPKALNNGSANLKPTLRAGTSYWSWSETYKNWNYFVPGYYYDESMLLIFRFKDSNNTPYSTINAVPSIDRIEIGSLIQFRTIYGLAKYFETYDFIAKTLTSYEISGIFEASLAGVNFLICKPNKILIELGNPYPVSGEFTLAILGAGACSVVYNGTCVVDAYYVGDDGVKGSSKILITPNFINSGTVSGNVRSPAEMTIAPDEMQRSLSNFSKQNLIK